MTLDQEDMAAIEALIRRVIREESLACSGSSVADPSGFKQKTQKDAAEHLRRLDEKRAKRATKSQGMGNEVKGASPENDRKGGPDVPSFRSP